MDMNQDNIFIRISKFGDEHSEWFTESEILNNNVVVRSERERKIIKIHLQNALDSGQEKNYIGGWEFNSDITTIITPIKESMFFVVERKKWNDWVSVQSDQNKFILSQSATFNYIDYLELQIVKAQSSSATRQAAISIRIASIALIVSIIFSVMQILTPTQLDKTQFRSIMQQLQKNNTDR